MSSNNNDILNEFKTKIHIRPNSSDPYLADILLGLLERYFDRVPDAAKIFELAKLRGDWIKNDHIAFRTLDIRSLLKVFLPYDYTVKFDDNITQTPFNFKQKKLTAVWLKHPNPDMPRIFISEYRLDESPEILPVITPYLEQLDDPIDTIDYKNTDAIIDYLHTGRWSTPSYVDYCAAQKVSEYLSWVLYNEYYLNHFTLTVNVLDSFGFKDTLNGFIENQKQLYITLPENQKKEFENRYLNQLNNIYKENISTFNNFLISEELTMNAPKGNNLNISADGHLLQSSTKANYITGTFPDGNHKVPGSYVEFAYRGLTTNVALDLLKENLLFKNINDSHLRDGFETANADKIFESTFTSNTTQQSDSKDVSKSFKKSKHRLLKFLLEYRS